MSKQYNAQQKKEYLHNSTVGIFSKRVRVTGSAKERVRGLQFDLNKDQDVARWLSGKYYNRDHAKKYLKIEV